jgi:xylan 1,4-beta-xylosidase
VAEAEMRLYELARRNGVHLQGAVTWAFEFEDQPAFSGFRSLATDGVDKPVLNVFRLLGMLGGQRTHLPAARLSNAKWLAVSSDGALPLDSILAQSVTGSPDINAVATRNGNEVDILLWNYHDADVDAPPATIQLTVDGLKGALAESEYLVDRTHSNAYAAWQKMGSPAHPDSVQKAALEKAAQLEEIIRDQPLPSTRASDGSSLLTLTLERQAVALIRLHPRSGTE